MSDGDEPAIAPRLLSLVPARAAGWTVHPPALAVLVVIDVGSAGVGVGVAIFGTGNGVVAMAFEPVTANSADIGCTFAVSQACPTQPRPSPCSIELSSEKWFAGVASCICRGPWLVITMVATRPPPGVASQQPALLSPSS